MLELSPRITYSPDNILELRKAVETDNDELQVAYSRHKEVLDGKPGIEVIEDGPETTVQVQIHKVVRTGKELNFSNPAADKLIDSLWHFTHFDYQDARDGVFSLDFWSATGATGVIYPQFQRWLNSAELSEEVARRCITAMAYPFGAEARKKAAKDFSYKTDGQNAMAGDRGFTFGVTSKRDKFGIAAYDEIGDEPIYKQGEVAWNWLDLSTIGSCACWGASWDERERVHITPETNRLYDMTPHNVDFAVQSLSLVLGAATLAYQAAKYTGTEDILANAEWREQRY